MGDILKVSNIDTFIKGGDYVMNKALLHSLMILNGDTQAIVASNIGIRTSSFNRKINEKNGAAFNQSEMLFLKEKYNMSDSTFIAVFFARFFRHGIRPFGLI